MNADQYARMMIGNMVIQLAQLQGERDALQEQMALLAKERDDLKVKPADAVAVPVNGTDPVAPKPHAQRKASA